MSNAALLARAAGHEGREHVVPLRMLHHVGERIAVVTDGEVLCEGVAGKLEHEAALVIVLVIAARHDGVLARTFAVASTVLMLGVAVALLVLASDGEVRSYALGAWPAPFGIVLALDRLSALMLVLTAVLGLGVLLYAKVLGTEELAA